MEETAYDVEEASTLFGPAWRWPEAFETDAGVARFVRKITDREGELVAMVYQVAGSTRELHVLND